MIHKSISDTVPGLDKVWFFSDNFGFTSYTRHFYQRPSENFQGYVKENYEVSGFLNNKRNSLDNSTVSRLRNLFPVALGSYASLPKLLVIVPDDDVIMYIRSRRWKMRPTIKSVVVWLMSEYDKMILAYKDYLPTKAVRTTQPYIIWIEPPVHVNFTNNEERQWFTEILRDTSKKYTNVLSLGLKKVWDPEDNSLYLYKESRFTAAGLNAYWEAVDRTVCYADTTLVKKG